MNNIYLVGMPGCGKTTISSIIVQNLKNTVLTDLDEYIVSREGKSIEELFEVGEKHFRERETEALKELSARDGILVATGGGVVTTEENIDIMRSTGKVVFIDASPEFIMDKSALLGRPLLKDKNKLYELYNNRIALYRKSADYTIVNDGILSKVCARTEEVIRQIIKDSNR